MRTHILLKKEKPFGEFNRIGGGRPLHRTS